MSGHSKWSQIKHKKALTDARKGKLFSKIAAQITVATKNGGDPAINHSLRDLIETAKSAGLPKENIERAIQRGSGELGGGQLEETRYEAYGPGGTAFIIDAITDNKNRALSAIRSILNRSGGKLAQSGSVSFLFEPKGVITVNNRQLTIGQDELQLMAIDAGAEDIDESDEELTIIYTKPNELARVAQTLKNQNVVTQSSELSLKPKTTIKITDLSSAKKVVELAQTLDDLDEVTRVSTNFEIDESLANQV